MTEFDRNVPQIAAASGHRSLTTPKRYNPLRRTATETKVGMTAAAFQGGVTGAVRSLAAAYQRAGQIDEARAAIQKGLKLRPGTTALNVAPPMKKTSPVYREAAARIVRLVVDAGLPAQ
ncbi:tetratricopeptide repeat protein [Bradyrhizobium oligotrophicum S58]